MKHQLNVTTPSDREIAMTRVFDAPRDLVFDCWTIPALPVSYTHLDVYKRQGTARPSTFRVASRGC